VIYELVKRDPLWKTVPYMTIAAAFILPLVIANRSRGVFLIPDSIFVWYFFMAGTGWIQLQERDTRFKAGLPISVGNILWARVFSMTVLVCLPLIAAAAALFIFRGPASWESSSVLLELAALYPPMILLMEFVAIRESRLGNHRLLVAAFNGVCMVCPVTALEFAKTAVVAVWSIFSIVLVLAVWLAIPNVLQVAPKQSRRTIAPAEDMAGDANDDPWTARTIKWLPVLRSLFPPVGLIWLLFLSFMALTAASFSSLTFLCFGVWFCAMLPRQGIRWLSAFPIQRRILLAGIVTPILLIVTAAFFAGGGEYAGVFQREIPMPVSPPLRMQILHLAAFLGLVLFVVLLTGLADWYRFGRLSRPVRWVLWSLLVLLPLGGMIGIDLLNPKTGVTSSVLIERALQWISWVLPGSLTIAIVTAATPLIALIWAIDKLFRESEFVSKPDQRSL
jgi:hypothetical protein